MEIRRLRIEITQTSGQHSLKCLEEIKETKCLWCTLVQSLKWAKLSIPSLIHGGICENQRNMNVKSLSKASERVYKGKCHICLWI